MEAKPFISVVSPVYEGEQLVNLLIGRTQTALLQITDDFEIILVDDGSSDNSVAVIEQIIQQHKKIKCVVLDKNYGQHTAIKAGLDNCSGTWVVVMDCDLQDQPEAIIELMKKAEEGFDAVFAARIKRNDPKIKQWYSTAFYAVLSFLSGIKTTGSTANFGIYNQKIIQQICQASYYNFFFPVAVRKATQLTANCPVDHGVRAAGNTTYTFGKALNLAIKVIFSNTRLSFFQNKKPVNYGVKQFINFEK